MDLQLTCQKEFTAGGKSYGPGDPIAADDYLEWPEASLPNRLQYGFVTWERVDAPAAPAVIGPTADELADARAARGKKA